MLKQAIPIDWQEIDTVFLDMDGTLLDLHFDNHFWLEHMPKCYAEKYNLPYEEASKILLQHADSTQGSLNWYCLDHWAEELQMDIVALKHEVANKITIRTNVIEFLSHLRMLGKDIVLLTNAHINSVNLKFSYVEIEEFFDEVITSHNIGFAKEQHGFWEALREHKIYQKDRCLFIDDNLDVLDNARKFGIKHLLAISKPDSQKPRINTNDYVAIDDYRQLIH